MNERVHRFKQLNDKKWLHRKYWVDELSHKQIADIIGCAQSTVSDAFIRLNIPIIPHPSPFSEREIKYILENKDIISQSEIAENLSEMYPEDNAGKRTRAGVHTLLQRFRKENNP